MGNATRGNELVEQVGWLACHAVADMPVDRPTDPNELGYVDPRLPMVGPELNQMGSKVTEEWLVSWLKEPKHYWAGTSMPNMKLSDQEAFDISAYLLSMRNENFDAQLPPMPDDEVRDEVIAEFLSGQMHSEAVEVKLASMSLGEKQL